MSTNISTKPYRDEPDHFFLRILLSMSNKQTPSVDHHSQCLSALPSDSALPVQPVVQLLAVVVVGIVGLAAHSGDKSVASWTCCSAVGFGRAMDIEGRLSIGMRSVGGMPSFGGFVKNISMIAQTCEESRRVQIPSQILSDWHHSARRGSAGCNAQDSPSRGSWCSGEGPRTAWLAGSSGRL
jgi:hypothetical protein